MDPNFVKVTPGHQASNYSEPNIENGDIVFVENSNNFGTGDQFYKLSTLSIWDTVRFEIVASLDTDEDSGDLENKQTKNPSIFSYVINSEGLSSDCELNVENLTPDTLSMYLSMPGVEYNNDNSEICIKL